MSDEAKAEYSHVLCKKSEIYVVIGGDDVRLRFSRNNNYRLLGRLVVKTRLTPHTGQDKNP
jgi:hypothetical protein